MLPISLRHFASTNTSGTKRTNDVSHGNTEGGEDQNQNNWSRNRDMSPVAGRQRTRGAKAQKIDKKDE